MAHGLDEAIAALKPRHARKYSSELQVLRQNLSEDEFVQALGCVRGGVSDDSGGELGVLVVAVTRSLFAFSSFNGVETISIPHTDVAVYWAEPEMGVTLYDLSSYLWVGDRKVFNVYRSYVAMSGAQPDRY